MVMIMIRSRTPEIQLQLGVWWSAVGPA